MLKPKEGFSGLGREKISAFFVAIISLWLVISAVCYIEFLFDGNNLASRDDNFFTEWQNT
ncbi:hypothetical protein [Pseudomonas thivervalensis]|uniref:hypothetical protein n=1 Tax=Pseudomonas thivervalensis TaxID=86265 RepID=UPI0012E30F61|nr:hypothetical protein [Pseudomonas thivervalensis]